jgi:hypothetical protein
MLVVGAGFVVRAGFVKSWITVLSCHVESITGLLTGLSTRLMTGLLAGLLAWGLLVPLNRGFSIVELCC